jgi:hypothetical protein
MNLQSQFNTDYKQSQDYPGFAIMMRRAVASVILIGALLLAFIGLDDNPEKFLLSLPEAQASAGMNGNAIELTSSQKSYLKRALHSNPENLVKLQGASIRAAFQDPEMIRADLPTVVWQYRSEKCVLDIYFKSKNTNADLANVVHYEMRHRVAGQDDFAGEKACLKSLMPSMNSPRLLSVSAIYKSYIQ